MSKILVWKCDHTGKLFEDEKKYRSHLAKLARERRERRKIQIANEEAQVWWTGLQNREMYIDDLAEVIIKEQNRFWAESAKSDPWHWEQIGKKRKGVVMPVPKLVEFTTFRLSWSDSVSNTHSCPKDGVTNWGGRVKDAPRGYPGWRGRMEWRIEWPKEWDGCYPGSDLFKGRHVCIHTGTGGGGGWKDGHQSFGYDVEIFASDWPGLKRFRDKQFVWKTLGGDPNQVRTKHEKDLLREEG